MISNVITWMPWLLTVILLVFLLYTLWQQKMTSHVNEWSAQQQQTVIDNMEERQKVLMNQLTGLQESINKNAGDHNLKIQEGFNKIDKETNKLVGDINDKMGLQFGNNLDRTNRIFNDVQQQLTSIKTIQQQLTNTSNDVAGNINQLQNLLTDKQSRGVIGEIQLITLIKNTMPSNSFSFQYTLSNSKRVDCVLFLPKPISMIAIDAKFPLDHYRSMHKENLTPAQKKQYRKQFNQDVRKHIQDITSKYIILGETAESAMMFVPAEAIFADIHAHHHDLVNFAHQSRVWMVSPTTMMAILTTAYAVLKDASTREQVSTIQKLLIDLSKDFTRFQKRADNLRKHVHLLSKDIDEIHTSSHKITQRFQKIERVELPITEELAEIASE